jgi:hypothetical protein
MDDLRALGAGTLGMVNTGILLAVVAVVLASASTPGVVTTAFRFLAWLVGLMLAPLAPGKSVTLGTGYADAGGFATGSGTGGSSGGPGTTPAPSSTTPGTSGGGFIDSGSFDTGGAGAPPGTGTGTSGTPQQWWGVDAGGHRLGLTTDPQNFPVPGATSYQPSVAGS